MLNTDHTTRLYAAYRRALTHDYTQERLVLERAVNWARLALRAERARNEATVTIPHKDYAAYRTYHWVLCLMANATAEEIGDASDAARLALAKWPLEGRGERISGTEEGITAPRCCAHDP